jgi:crossover junction endodeoxyribonuclease RusA
MTTILLPIPPSVNGAWINLPKGGRARSKKYTAWAKAAGWELLAQRPRKVIGPYEIRIILGNKRNRGDADNRIKSLVDLVVKHGIVEDDRRMVSVTCGWSDEVEPGMVRVIVEAINAG